MIKKLKHRFVFLSMLIIGVLMAIFYLFACALFFMHLTEKLQNSLMNYSSLVNYDEGFNIGDSDDSDIINVIDDGKVCVVSVSSDGEIKLLDSGHGYMEKDILDDAVDYSLNSDYIFGHIASHMLFFCKSTSGDEIRIAFADSSGFYNYLRIIMVDGAVLCGIALIILFIVSNILASVFISPMKKNWDQQKNFIADASHELKTPLTVVLANCKILEAHPDSTVEEQMKWIKSTDEEASHMKELVNKLLFLAKNDSVKSDKISESVNISDMATRLALQFEPVAYENGVTVYSDIEKGLIIRSDPTAVNQIIHILIDNAVKYAGIGGEVKIDLRKKNKNVYLYTKNTGAPIGKEEIAHIFERFYRSDKARTSGSGYGLGLPICRSLVNGIGANITVTSDAENGTVFTVKFKIK